MKQKGEEGKQKNQEELINFLQSKIDEIEKKLQTTQKVSKHFTIRNTIFFKKITQVLFKNWTKLKKNIKEQHFYFETI